MEIFHVIEDFISFRKIILFSFQLYKYFFKIGLEIYEKLQVEQTKLQICHSQSEILSLHKKVNGFLKKQKY